MVDVGRMMKDATNVDGKVNATKDVKVNTTKDVKVNVTKEGKVNVTKEGTENATGRGKRSGNGIGIGKGNATETGKGSGTESEKEIVNATRETILEESAKDAILRDVIIIDAACPRNEVEILQRIDILFAFLL